MDMIPVEYIIIKYIYFYNKIKFKILIEHINAINFHIISKSLVSILPVDVWILLVSIQSVTVEDILGDSTGSLMQFF